MRDLTRPPTSAAVGGNVARSAAFVPVRNLSVIVVDEEHEPSYKADNRPRYHARDVGIVRAQAENALSSLKAILDLPESVELTLTDDLNAQVPPSRCVTATGVQNPECSWEARGDLQAYSAGAEAGVGGCLPGASHAGNR